MATNLITKAAERQKIQSRMVELKSIGQHVDPISWRLYTSLVAPSKDGYIVDWHASVPAWDITDDGFDLTEFVEECVSFDDINLMLNIARNKLSMYESVLYGGLDFVVITNREKVIEKMHKTVLVLEHWRRILVMKVESEDEKE